MKEEIKIFLAFVGVVIFVSFIGHLIYSNLSVYATCDGTVLRGVFTLVCVDK